MELDVFFFSLFRSGRRRSQLSAPSKQVFGSLYPTRRHLPHPSVQSRALTETLAGVCFALLLAFPAQASTWNKSTSNYNWSDTANWTGGIPNGASATADFSTLNITGNITVILDKTYQVNSLTFGDTNTTSAGGWILSDSNSTEKTLTLSGSTPTITVGTLASGSIANISAILLGSNGLTKAGAGTLQLSKANTYSGATIVNDGILKAGVASVANTSGAFGKNSAITLANATGVVMDITGFNTQIGALSGGGTTGGNVTLGAAVLTVGGDNNASPATYAGVISGTGGLTKIGTGTQILSGANTYSGTTSVNAGILELNGGSLGGTALTVGTATANASLKVTGNYTMGTTGSARLTLAGGTGSGTGRGTMNIVDGAINTLTIHNTTSGATALTIGSNTNGTNSILNFEVGNTSDSIVLGSGLKASIGSSTTKNTVNITGIASLSGSQQTLIHAPGGLIAGSFSNFELGTTTGNFGGHSVALASDSTHLFLNESANAAPATAYWKGTNDGVWNSFTGGNTNTSNFATDIGGTNATGKVGDTTDVIFNATSHANSASTTLGENLTIKTLTFAGNATTAVGIGGSNTLTIASASSASGITVATGSGNHTLSTKVALGANQTWTVTDSGQILMVSNEISGAHSITKAGDGTLTLSGSNTHTGATTVSAGKLLIKGSIGYSDVTVESILASYAEYPTANIGKSLIVNSGGILAVGDSNAAGMATVTTTTTFNNGSIFSWDINSDGTNYDKLITASVMDGGTPGGAIFRIVASDALVAQKFWDTPKSWVDILTKEDTTTISNWTNIFTTIQVVNSSGFSITPTTGTFTMSGNTLRWNYTAVPEPTGALAGLLLGAGLLRRKRVRNMHFH